MRWADRVVWSIRRTAAPPSLSSTSTQKAQHADIEVYDALGIAALAVEAVQFEEGIDEVFVVARGEVVLLDWLMRRLRFLLPNNWQTATEIHWRKISIQGLQESERWMRVYGG